MDGWNELDDATLAHILGIDAYDDWETVDDATLIQRLDLEGKPFAVRLRAIRLVRSGSRYRLAHDSGLSRTYVMKLEEGQGSRVGHDTLTNLAEALHVAPSTLTGRLDARQVEPPDPLTAKLAALTPAERAAVEGMIDHLLSQHPAPAPKTRRQYREATPPPPKPGTGELRILGQAEGTRAETAEDTQPREALR